MAEELKDSPFTKVELATKGESAPLDHVAFAMIPSFITSPEVVLWGARVFKYYPTLAHPLPLYVECFAVAITFTETEDIPVEQIEGDTGGEPVEPG